MKEPKGLSSKAVHSGTGPRDAHPVTTPIFQSSTFYANPEVYSLIQSGKARETTFYTRYGNPTRRAVEEKIAALEGAEDAIAFSSGLAAATSVIMGHLKPGDSMITTLDIYGGTAGLFRNRVERMGIEVIYADMTRPDLVEKAIKPSTKLMFFESISNPLLKILDIPTFADIAGRHNMLLVVDNTFATPINQRPLELGASISLASASKYLNGHSDLIAGVAAGPKSLLDPVWAAMRDLGGSMEAFSAFLLERGLKTLAVRVKAHNENALAVARFLEDHPRVKRVFYPGLPSHPQHELAKRMLSGFGGMLSFVVEGGDEAALKLMSSFRLIAEATSLGGVESLVSTPATTTHAGYTPEERLSMGIEPGFLRLSVGIEDPEDIIEDLDQALANL
ncbi:MAG: PLP-dependent aspartate aminotransferase family protein [candidate division WOR-3 bacterium]